MVPFEAIARVVEDAARLVMKGELLVSGSAALAFWAEAGPPARFVDLGVAPEAAAAQVEKMMGPNGWYDRTFGYHVLVSPPDTFIGPAGWAARARRTRFPEARTVEVVVPHPHDVIMAKLERFDAQDQAQVRLVLQGMAMSENELDTLAASMPQRDASFDDEARRKRFDFNVTRLRPILYAVS